MLNEAGFRPRSGVSRVVAPASEPLVLSDVKVYLRVDGSDEDALIGQLIVAAREAAEQHLRRSLVTQTWERVFEEVAPELVALPMGPVVSVESVLLRPREGSDVEMDAALYRLNAARDALVLDEMAFADRVVVRYVAGYGDAEDVPAAIRQGILAHVAGMYEQRADVAVPDVAMALYAGYRVGAL